MKKVIFVFDGIFCRNVSDGSRVRRKQITCTIF